MTTLWASMMLPSDILKVHWSVQYAVLISDFELCTVLRGSRGPLSKCFFRIPQPGTQFRSFWWDPACGRRRESWCTEKSGRVPISFPFPGFALPMDFSGTYTRHAAVPVVSLLVMCATVHLLRWLNSEVHRHRGSSVPLTIHINHMH